MPSGPFGSALFVSPPASSRGLGPAARPPEQRYGSHPFLPQLTWVARLFGVGNPPFFVFLKERHEERLSPLVSQPETKRALKKTRSLVPGSGHVPHGTYPVHGCDPGPPYYALRRSALHYTADAKPRGKPPPCGSRRGRDWTSCTVRLQGLKKDLTSTFSVCTKDACSWWTTTYYSVFVLQKMHVHGGQLDIGQLDLRFGCHLRQLIDTATYN